MLKIYTLLSFLYLLPIVTKAQFEPGQKVIGGSFSFNQGKDESPYDLHYTSHFSSVYINTSKGQFRKPNILRGMAFSYNYSFQETEYLLNRGRTNNHTIGAEVFSQRFIPLTTNFFATIKTSAGAGYQFGNASNINNSNPMDSKSRGFVVNIAVAPGLSYKLSNRFLFDAFLSDFVAVGYSNSTTKVPTSSDYTIRRTKNNFRLSTSLSNTNLGSIGLGFRWLPKL